MCNEIWKDIEGYEGKYQISNLGRIKKINKTSLNEEHYLKPYVNQRGYCTVKLFKTVRKEERIHRLVAQAFISNPENKTEVNHIDGNKQNNTTANLEWTTPEENVRHAFKTGLNRGRKPALTDKQKCEIKLLYKPYDKQCNITALSKKFGVSRNVIIRALNK